LHGKFTFVGEKPYWWDLTGEFEIIQSEANKAIESRSSYVIKFVNDLRQVGGFLCILKFPPPIKLTATI
jgi:hypothetical protein